MGKGIKKISENVIADKRSLTLVTCNAAAVSKFADEGPVPSGIQNTEAMPLGMLNVDYYTKGLTMKVKQFNTPSESAWSKFDATNTLITGSVMESLIANNAVTESKIKNDSVTENKIKNNSISTNKIKDKAIVSAKIADSAVVESKINNGSVTTSKIANNAVTNPKLAPDSVYGAVIQNGAITTYKIANYGVTKEKIADGSIVTSKIFNGAVTTDKIADASITSNKIKDGAVISSKIPASQITTNHLQNGSVTLAKMAANSVGSAQLKPGCITKDKLSFTLGLDSLDKELSDIIKRSVLHDGKGNVTGNNKSTTINNLTATGDIYANRVYNVVYMDIAEGYVPGEELMPGDIVAMHEDGKVYKATSINECIVGVVSNEFANCLGASKEELFEGSKVAVGMIGKIHVKVKGPVRLGQKVIVSLSDAGVGMATWMNGGNHIGQVLETVDCDFDEIHTVLVQVRPM